MPMYEWKGERQRGNSAESRKRKRFVGFLCCGEAGRKQHFDKCNFRPRTKAIDNEFQIGQPTHTLHTHSVIPSLPLPPSPSFCHTYRQPLLAGDFISLATSSVLQRKHLRCFICLYCLPRCPLVAAPLSLHSLLLLLLSPYSSVCPPSSLLSPCVLLPSLRCYVCDLLFRQEIKFSLFVPFLAKTQTTPHSPHPPPSAV